ncbi:hypothetical protein [Streptomyces malaysiensis]|nr:hypothetical protein [Streptomyces malaysiensis]
MAGSSCGSAVRGLRGRGVWSCGPRVRGLRVCGLWVCGPAGVLSGSV